MGIFNNSRFKGKKWGQKNVEQEEMVVETKDAPVSPKADVVESPKKEKKVTERPVQKIKTVDPSREFQMMYGLADIAEEVPEKIQKDISASVEPTTDEPIGAFGKPSFLKVKPIKRLINKRLTIILIENTDVVAKEKEKVLQIVECFTKSDLTCIINYGETVTQSEIFEFDTLNAPTISYNEMTGEKACLFDALVEVEKLVLSKYLSIEERTNDRLFIDSIEIIGIGTCRDNCSVTPKEKALDCFEKISAKNKIVTKYYCLTDEYFIGAAEVGFHSIGAISRTYQ